MAVKRTLIRGGAILSVDPMIGVLRSGDLLVEDGRIAAVAPHVDADDAEVIDATGLIAIPGMVDGHKHTWQTIFRGTSGDETLAQFFGEAVPATAPRMTPQDVYASNLLGAVDAMDAGVTTFVELGAKDVLTTLLKRIDANARGVAVGTPEAVAALGE